MTAKVVSEVDVRRYKILLTKHAEANKRIKAAQDKAARLSDQAVAIRKQMGVALAALQGIETGKFYRFTERPGPVYVGEVLETSCHTPGRLTLLVRYTQSGRTRTKWVYVDSVGLRSTLVEGPVDPPKVKEN